MNSGNILLEQDKPVAVFKFIIQLVIVLVASVSIVPLLPRFMLPQLVTLFLVGSAIDGRSSLSIQWAIWGGLLLDLLSPGQFGMIWLPTLIVGLLLFVGRRFVSVEQPWLWPIWFLVAAGMAVIPLAISTGEWMVFSWSIIATTAWGVVSVGFLQWFRSSRRGQL